MQGWVFFGAVVAFNVGLPLIARAKGRTDLVRLWAFLLPLSIFQLLPDWVLADLLGTIVFPDHGGPRVDDLIPLAMCGAWVAPLFVSTYFARDSALRAGMIALAIFTVSELLAPSLGIWEPTDLATQVAGVALYVLPAELLLGSATFLAYRWIGNRPRLEQVAVALGVATLYLGAMVLGYFLIDVAGFSLTV